MIKPAEKHGERCPFCGHEGQLKQQTLELWYVECSYCEARTGLYDYESDALDAWNDRTFKRGYWERHDESDTWECSSCHACFDLDGGTPKYLNYCPVCGTKLKLPD